MAKTTSNRRDRRHWHPGHRRWRRTKNNNPQPTSKPQAHSHSHSHSHSREPPKSGWGAYANNSSLPSFSNFMIAPKENQQSGTQGQGTTTQLRCPSDSTNQSTGSKETESSRTLSVGPSNRFGCPGPRDPRFQKLVVAVKPALAAPVKRTLEDVLLDHPEVQFLGIHQGALNQAATVILQVTDEVMTRWMRHWFPRTNHEQILGRIRAVDDIGDDPNGEVLAVPTAALGTKGTGTTLAKLYHNCRATHLKHPTPDPAAIEEIANRCMILCRVLKDAASAALIKNVMLIARWLPISLGCRLLDVQKEASKELSRKVPRGKSRLSKKEEWRILNKALLSFDIHRGEATVEFLKHVKILLEITDPVDFREGRNNPSINPPVVPATHSDKGADSEIIVISDSE